MATCYGGIGDISRIDIPEHNDSMENIDNNRHEAIDNQDNYQDNFHELDNNMPCHTAGIQQLTH